MVVHGGCTLLGARRLFRNDHDAHDHLIIILFEVVLHPAGIGNSPLRVVDHAEERATLGMLLVFRDVDYELLAELLPRQVWPRHLELHDRLDLRQEKVHARRCARVAWRPFLLADVLEMDRQERVKEVLQVVLVHHVERRAPFSPFP